jgi:hypothetical protein
LVCDVVGFVGLTLFAAVGFAVFGGHLGRATATRTAAASK